MEREINYRVPGIGLQMQESGRPLWSRENDSPGWQMTVSEILQYSRRLKEFLRTSKGQVIQVKKSSAGGLGGSSGVIWGRTHHSTCPWYVSCLFPGNKSHQVYSLLLLNDKLPHYYI